MKYSAAQKLILERPASANGTSPAATASACDLSELRLISEPFPHVRHDEFIEPHLYSQLRDSFPTCPATTGPTGFSLYWGDPGYQDLLRQQPAWQALFDTFHSQHFIDWGRRQFTQVWEAAGCKINLSDARYVPYREDRIDKERAKLRRIEHEPHELWVRMDIHQGRLGYDRPVHLDHARRLISMLVYLCDQAENEMMGGELFLHRGARRSARLLQAAAIKPQHNLMVAFPCTDRSYHSVSPITAQRTPRNYIQVHVSSSVDVWPRPRVDAWRAALGTWKKRLISGPVG